MAALTALLLLAQAIPSADPAVQSAPGIAGRTIAAARDAEAGAGTVRAATSVEDEIAGAVGIAEADVAGPAKPAKPPVVPGESGPARAIAAVTAARFGTHVSRATGAAQTESPTRRWQAHIDEASHRFGVPAVWIERVMRAESGGRTLLGGRPITSRAGAMGLMQIMPATWAELRARLGLGDDPHDPRDNILAGTFYLRLMYDRFGYPGLFGAYNAGPARYAAWLAGRQPLPRETRDYLATVGGGSAAGRVPPPAAGRAVPVRPPLFAVRNTVSTLYDTEDPERHAMPAAVPDLFAIERTARAVEAVDPDPSF